MSTKKYRFLLLITILFSLSTPCISLTDRDKKIINKLAKDSLLLYAAHCGMPRENHLKNITGLLFGKSNIALEILTKKIMRHVCKQLYLQGLPTLALHAAALKRFEKYQRPSHSKNKTRSTSSRSSKTHWLSNVSKFAIIVTALLLVFMALGALLHEKEDHKEDIIALIAIVKNQQESLLSRVRNLDAQASLLNAKFDLCETLTKNQESRAVIQTELISRLEAQLKTLEEQITALKPPSSRPRKW